MDMPLPSQLLAAQHRRIDQGVLGILDGTDQPAALADSLALLRLHLYVEEEVLFPPLVKAGLTMPVFVMKREHGEMWPLLQTLTAACGSASLVEALREPCGQLFQLLQIHNPKEEQIVYSAVDRLADASLTETLQTTRVPDDWTCAMAPR